MGGWPCKRRPLRAPRSHRWPWRRGSRGSLVGLCTALLLVGATVSGPRLPEWRAEASDVRVERDGNVLLARRSPAVPFERLEQLLTGIEQRPAPRGAIRLVREGAGQLIDYFLCVTPEGRLVVGQQLWRRDPGSGDYVFERGELARAYSPLEGDGTWTWMFHIAVARESDVTLVARADGDRWPVRFVTISVLGAS